MTGFAVEGKDVLDRAEVDQVPSFRADLLHQFAVNRICAVFAKFDTPAQWTIESLAFGRVAFFGDEDLPVVLEDADG